MSATQITRVHARRVFDSRGRPTLEVDVELAGGARGRAIAPAGASRGSHEAVELRDGGTRFGGLDVMGAIAAVEGPIAHALAGRDARDQQGIDAALVELDGTPQKSRLGGNATVATSLAVAHAAAAAAGVPLWRHLAHDGKVTLPLPQIQIFGGGAHAGRRIDLQDLMVMPIGAWTFGDALAIVADVYHAAGALMQEEGKLAGVADEGGFWPLFTSNEEAIATLTRAIERANLQPGVDAAIALDVAASEFAEDGRYRLACDGVMLDRDELAALLLRWVERYPIRSIEDPFAENDRVAWIAFMRAAPARLQVVGDDYLVTSAARIDAAAVDHACNAALVKVNQAGTVSEAHAALDTARRAGFRTIVSARSGESEDVSIAHLAVGWNAGQIKVGAFARSERMAKWNELLRIEEAGGGALAFAGAGALNPA
jgi:enolase